MSYASRLEAQNDRIRRNIAAERITLGDDRNFITEDHLLSIWMRQFGDEASKTELDEFQECVPSPDLARNMYSAIKTISILVCIHWDQWDEFAERFCRLTDTASLDDLQNVDAKLPFAKESLEGLLFPNDSYYAENFFLEQYVFLPLVLQENQRFKSFESEYRLALLEDSIAEVGGHCERIMPIKVATAHFRFARGGELNSTPHSLRRKRIIASPAIEREIQNLAVLRSTEEMSERIMRHIVALKIGHEYNIFFDEAELDLAALLNGEYHPYYADSAMAPQPLVAEAWSLAGALHFIHHRLVDRRTHILCCHMDLKPANILIVRNVGSPVGKWMLTDFGISVIKTEPRSGCCAVELYGDESLSTFSVTTSMRYSNGYQPPEVGRRSSVSHGGEDERKGDIWSFGCILTALLLFSLGGAPFVRRLHTTENSEGQTNFSFSTVGTGTIPIWEAKQQMQSWVSQLNTHQGSWVFDWLQIIFDHMLRMSPAQRHQAQQIQNHLDLVWSQAPKENIWRSPLQQPDQYLQVPHLRPRGPESSCGPQSTVSLQSSGPTIPSSTHEPSPATAPNGERNGDVFIVVRSPPPVDSPDLSPRRSNSTGTFSTASERGQPVEEINFRDELPDVDDIAVSSESARVVFWHRQNVILYSPERPLFSREIGAAVNVSLKAIHPARWVDVSLSNYYVALAILSPSSIQVRVMDLHNGHDVQPNTGWPSLQGLRSVCISSCGTLALIYDKAVTFRCTGVESHLQNSSWGTRSENICSASFSQDGNRLFVVSWNKLWIGSVVENKWVLRVCGDHHLSVTDHMSFKPYLIPFTSREALLAHNPNEDRLRYLEARTSTKVDLGAGVVRVALSEAEDVLIFIRKLQRGKRFSSHSYYGLSWRSIGRIHAGAMSLGVDSNPIDLHISVERGKKFSITASVEQGTTIAWVATASGEIRKCQLV